MIAEPLPQDASRMRRRPLRGSFVGTFLLLSLFASAAPRLHGQEAALDFRRTYVPRAEVENVGAGFVPLPRDKFEETVARLRDERSAATPTRTSLTSAAWVGVFDGENVTGVARWTPPRAAEPSKASTAVLGTTSLFLDPAFSAEDAPALPEEALAILHADEEAAAALASEQADRPRLFLRADGLLGAEFPEGRPATTAWSARTTAGENGSRSASWRLPEALRTTLWLVVPPGIEVASSSGWLVERVPTEAPTDDSEANANPRIYRLLGHPLDEAPLQLQFASTSEPPAEELLYRVADRYVRSSQGLDVEYELAIDCRAGTLSTLRLLLPPSVSPIELLHDDARLELVRAAEAPPGDAPGSVEWTASLPDPIGPSFATFELRGVMTSEPSDGGPLPRLRLLNATWAGETSTIVAEAPHEIQGIVADECFAVVESQESVSAGERFRHRTENSAIAVRFGRPPGRTSVESMLSLRAGRSSLEASLFAEISATEGPTFEQELRLLQPWSLDRIEAEPAGALLDWSIDERRTIRLRFRDGLAPGETLRLRCDAHLRVDDPSVVRSGETLRAFEFEQNVRENRAIALFDDATFRFRPVRIIDWRTLARGELSAAQRAGLGSSASRAILPDDASFRATEFAFETEESRLDVRSTTTIERSGASVAGRVHIECVSLSAPIERLQVALSSPLPPGSRWTSSDAADVPFEAQRIADGDGSSESGETWELIFARPASTPFAVQATYELPEESFLAAPLASVPAAATQTGRLSIAGDLLEEREASGVGLERVPAIDETNPSGDTLSVRFRYDPARRHSASIGPAAGSGAATLAMRGPASLETEVSSAGLHHVLTYPIAASSASETKLAIVPPAACLLSEVRAIGEEEYVVASAAQSDGTVQLTTPRGLSAVQVRFFQPLPSFALWSEQRVPLPQIKNVTAEAVEWTVRSRGAVAFAVDADGWNGRERSDDPPTNSSPHGESATDETAPSTREEAFISVSAAAPLALKVYRTGSIVQTAWIAFFAVAATLWALASRAPAISAFAIATLAATLFLLPEPAEALRWGVLYGAATGLVCAVLFRRDQAVVSVSQDSIADKPSLASALVLLTLFSAGAISTFAQEVVAPLAETRTYRVLIPTDDAGRPTGDYYYASREFYDRFLAAQRELARPDEEWRIVDAVYEGTMSPGVIDGMPRLSQLTLHLEIETFADDVVATIPLDRRYAEFAGMMEDGGAGSVEADWNEAGDALSLRFEKAGRRELAIPFYPAADPDSPGVRSAKILPIPWAKLFVRGPAEGLDDLAVVGNMGAGESRPARDETEIDLGLADRVAFASRRTSSSASAGPAIRWSAGLRIAGDPNACRIDAKVAGAAPLGVLVSRTTVAVGPGWKIDTAAPPAAGFHVEPAELNASGERRYGFVFDEAQTGEIEFDFVLIPEGSRQAGLFRTPRLSIDEAPPAATFATLEVSPSPASDAPAAPVLGRAEWSPAALGRAASAREVPAALALPAGAGSVRLLPPGESANFLTSDPATRSFYAVQAEFVVSPSDLRVRYEIAMPSAPERWREFDLPEAIEVLNVYRGSAPSRTPSFWRRDGRRLVVRGSSAGTPLDSPVPLVIEGSIRGLGDGTATLATPRLRGASLSEIDLRVYRASELDVSIDAGSGFGVNPTFVPGAFVEGKGRGVGAFLSANVADASREPPASLLLRSRRARPGRATIWTTAASQDGLPTARFEIEVDARSGTIDRLAVEAPATLGEPTVVSPPGVLTVRTAANADRRYWIFVPVQPLAPGATITLSAPLETAATERIVVRPIRLLNVETTRRFALLPERIADRDVLWSVTRLQAAPDEEAVRRRVAAIGSAALAFEAHDDTYSARARRVDPQATTPFAIRWTERRMRFEAPGEYRASVSWDLLPQERSSLDIRMPADTTIVALEVDGVPCRWTTNGQGIRTKLLPSALPFRVTLVYRGTTPIDAAGSTDGQATLTLASPTIGAEASRGEAWVVEASSAAPWSAAESGESGRGALDYVAARLAAFETTFSAAAPRTEGCTSEEARSFARRRLRDLAELERRTNAEPASQERDDLLNQIDAATKPYRDVLVDAAEAGTTTSDAESSPFASDSSLSPSIDRDNAKLLAIRLGQDTNLAKIELALTSRREQASVPWRRIAETSTIVLLCLFATLFGRRALRWFEQMPLPVGSLAFVLLAPLFVSAGWLAPAIVIAFLAFAAVAARRWLLPALPPARGRGMPAP
jgi:hypothetical protein